MAKKNTLFKLDLLVLAALMKKDFYGYEICRDIKEHTDNEFDIKEGVIYPILHNLVESEYISSYDKIVNRKIRVYYKMEEKGKVYFNELKNEYQKKISLLDHYIN